MSAWFYAEPVLVGYAIGSIPTGYWIGKVTKGIDVREHGSGNLGATNVFRVLGAGAGIATLVFDIFKGALAVLLFAPVFHSHTAGGDPIFYGPGWLAGLSAILGHSFSFWVRFRGGKGVATTAGAFLALLPIEAGIALIFFIVVFAISRIVSLSSMVAVVVLAIGTILFHHHPMEIAITSAVALFVIWRHHANIGRLIHGTEKRLSFSGEKKSS